MGEDASCAKEDILAVADGVGGWARHGVDPSHYSKQLIQNVLTNFYSKPIHFSTNTS